jgi:3-hydroxyacyl-[acyl-carrier-protein] dehydratase
MIFKDKFYYIQSFVKENESLLWSISINSDHDIFKGHFPDNPVTPGVVQIEIIKELLISHFNRDLKLKSISNCKFLSVLNPNKTPSVSVKMVVSSTEDLIIKISGTIFSAEVNYLKIQAEFQLQ